MQATAFRSVLNVSCHCSSCHAFPWPSKWQLYGPTSRVKGDGTMSEGSCKANTLVSSARGHLVGSLTTGRCPTSSSGLGYSKSHASNFCPPRTLPGSRTLVMRRSSARSSAGSSEPSVSY
eukprot:scaffold1919_cov394-Prasinococcus_capsulatus_cf.AAC.6